MAKWTRLFYTIRYLKPIQLYYRFFYILRNRFFKTSKFEKLSKDPTEKTWKDFLTAPASQFENQFIFLNQEHDFGQKVDWNFSGFGKLWTYNLNYFDFLNQSAMKKEEGLRLIEDYLQARSALRDGMEPYPISLRSINWIKFLSRNNIVDSNITVALYNDLQVLRKNVEYHLMGNHVLENGFSLLFGAVYFDDINLYNKAQRILRDQLEEQLLDDGGHFERSPMYHQILLGRLLDCIQFIRNNELEFLQEDFIVFLTEKAQIMSCWLHTITFKNGNIPMFNDSAFGIAPNSNELLAYAMQLGIEVRGIQLKGSGYRKFSFDSVEFIFDVGEIGPDYQPGHAHSDTFGFEFYQNRCPILVDTGTSTYEKNELRQRERGTAAHNTVKVGKHEQSEVWGGFRVAKRAKVSLIKDEQKEVQASHNGYQKIGVEHQRNFILQSDAIIIKDKLIAKANNGDNAVAFFHLHPKIKECEIKDNAVILPDFGLKLHFSQGILKIAEGTYEFAVGFNKRLEAKQLQVHFQNELTTTIQIETKID